MSKNTLPIGALKFNKNKYSNTNEFVPPEMPVQIFINQQIWQITMCSPFDLEDLTVGLLFSEKIINSYSDILCCGIHNTYQPIKAKTVQVILPKTKLNIQKKEMITSSACGICGTDSMASFYLPGKKIKNNLCIEANKIINCMEIMDEEQNLFKKTGGVHGAAAFNEKGEIISIKEDIGRHNALEKLIGNLLIQQTIHLADIITLSSRITYELVLKAYHAKIQIIVAVSAPSDLAIKVAQLANITIIGFCREGRFTIYSHPQRIKFD